jgi:hypothetical protein
MLAHIMGMPVEETVLLQLAPAGAVAGPALVIVMCSRLSRLSRRLRRRG